MTETSNESGAITQMSPAEALSALLALDQAMAMVRTRVVSHSANDMVSADMVLDLFKIGETSYGGLYVLASRASKLLGSLGAAFGGAMAVVVAASDAAEAYDAEERELAVKEKLEAGLMRQLSGGRVHTVAALTALEELTTLIEAKRRELQVHA